MTMHQFVALFGLLTLLHIDVELVAFPHACLYVLSVSMRQTILVMTSICFVVKLEGPVIVEMSLLCDRLGKILAMCLSLLNMITNWNSYLIWAWMVKDNLL